MVCGHIHKAEIRDVAGIVYCNDGDRVESCTALVEDFDGSVRLVRWAEPVTEAVAAPAELDAELVPL